MTLEGLTKGERFIVDWQFGIAGDFNASLIKAITSADIYNMDRLRKGFPDEVEAYENYTNTKGWWEDVRKKAGI